MPRKGEHSTTQALLLASTLIIKGIRAGHAAAKTYAPAINESGQNSCAYMADSPASMQQLLQNELAANIRQQQKDEAAHRPAHGCLTSPSVVAMSAQQNSKHAP